MTNHIYEIGDLVYFEHVGYSHPLVGMVVGYPDYIGDITIGYDGKRYGRNNSEVSLYVGVNGRTSWDCPECGQDPEDCYC